MERVYVNIPGKGYDVYVGRDIYNEALGETLGRLRPGKVVVVSHPSIMGLHGKRLLEAVKDFAGHRDEVTAFVFPEGEEGKNLKTLEEGYYFLAGADVNREDMLIAFGGGVVGDLTGYLAASYYRGMRYIQVPTTLMAMVDSSVGGKVGVDLENTKNAVGAFYQPEAVVSDIEVLLTLPAREYWSGMAEVAKYGFLFDQMLLDDIERSLEYYPETRMDPEEMVARCVEHKAGIVAEDVRDIHGVRALLNYGHTFGHAMESATAYRAMRHGEAVAAGMIMAAKAALRVGLAGEELVIEHEKILKPLLKEVELPAGLEAAAVMRDMKTDKKRGEEMRFILLEAPQKPHLVDGLAEEVIGEAIGDVIADIRGEDR
jgi:3-dehydroquinate synthase